VISCNVYILTDKTNKAVKIGITKKHPDVRISTINKEATKYKFVLHKFETMSTPKARWVENKLLDALEKMGGAWVEDDDFGGVTEVATLDVTNVVFDACVSYLDNLLLTLAEQEFKERSYTELENDSSVLKIPLNLLGAKYLHNLFTDAKIQLDLTHKVLLCLLKDDGNVDQSTLADVCGVSRHSVLRAISMLSSCGIVEVVKVRASNGAVYNNYVVHEIDGVAFVAYK